MQNTAIQAGAPPTANGHATAVTAEPPRVASRLPRPPKSPAMQVLEVLADLRITVVLFALSLFLVFWGTLAQVDKGVWTVVAEYFRSPVVWVPLKIVFFRAADVRGAIPYPGGWLLGAALLVNLLAAHAVRFKVSWRRSGILVIHAGIVIMMLGELVTGLFAVEGNMSIAEGSTSNYTEQYLKPELAVVSIASDHKDHVTVVPTDRLRRGGLIADSQLPFDVVVDEYMVNSRLVQAPPDTKLPTVALEGKRWIAQERPEGAGVDTDQKVDLASMSVTLKRKGTGQVIGSYLLTTHLLQPNWIEVDGKEYQVSLRFKRTYKPYTFRLDKLNVSYYPNTDKPKDYSSFIHLTDPSQNEDRDVRIWMNHPLTYAGETFYQSGVHREPGVGMATTLQVVHNPGWMMPYLSCFLVAGGMLVHFGQNLYRFLERRAA